MLSILYIFHSSPSTGTLKMFTVDILFLGLISLNLVSAQVSITTASGQFAPRGPFRPGQLIFEENFNELNFEKWQHELTVSGGGNWEFQW